MDEPSVGLQIRPASRDDVPLILSLIRAIAGYEKLGHEVTATEERLHETLFGAKPFAECLLAFLHGEPAGFAVYYFGYSTFVACPTLYVEDIFVHERFRGQGLGRQIFATVLATAERHACGKVEWSVLNWNAPAIAFYRRLGAEEMSEWRKYRLVGGQIAQALNGLKSLAKQDAA